MGHDIQVDDCHTVIENMYQYYKSYFFYFYKFTTRDRAPFEPNDVVFTPIKMHHGRSISRAVPSKVNITTNKHGRKLYPGDYYDDSRY